MIVRESKTYRPTHNAMHMHESPAKETLVMAPSRSGKTRSLIADVIKETWNASDGFGTLVVAPTYRDLYVLVEKATVDQLIRSGMMLPKGHNWSLHESTLRNGNTIYWRSAEDPERLTGMNVGRAYGDEFCLWKREALYEIRVRLLLSNGPLKLFSTPRGTSNWGFNEFFHPDSGIRLPQVSGPGCWDVGNTRLVRYDIRDNPHITQEAIDELAARLDPLSFRQNVYAEWVNLTEDRVYYAFTEANVKPCGILKGYPVYVGVDYNIGVNAYVVFQQPSSRELFVIAEGYGAKTTQDLAARILADWGNQVTIIDDASGNTRQQGDGKTNRQLLQQAGLHNITAYTKNPNRVNRYANTNAHFCNGLGNRRLFVNPSCKRLIHELNTLCYKSQRDEPDTQGGVAGHISDALGYGVWWISGGAAAWEKAA